MLELCILGGWVWGAGGVAFFFKSKIIFIFNQRCFVPFSHLIKEFPLPYKNIIFQLEHLLWKTLYDEVRDFH